ncbi:hypothetical protein JW758_05310 [Candidatus Peregrinibacteria bacterium]|nr:hypothetical protein [Candidatus Peregrinibacteria bacterium]
MAKKKDKSELKILVDEYIENPSSFNEIARSELKTMLLEKKAKKSLKKKEEKVLNDLSTVIGIKRKTIRKVLTGTLILGLGIWAGAKAIEGKKDKKPSEVNQIKYAPETEIDYEAEIKHQAEATDKQISIYKEVLEKWYELFKSNPDIIPNEIVRGYVDRNFKFIIKQLSQEDNNGWQIVFEIEKVKNPDTRENSLKTIYEAMKGRNIVTDGTRALDTTKYDHVMFQLFDTSKTTKMPTYEVNGAIISSEINPEIVLVYASLVMFHESNHALITKDKHERFENQLGRKASPEEHWKIDNSGMNRNQFLNEELICYAGEFEVLNILSHNKFRQTIKNGGNISQEDLNSLLYKGARPKTITSEIEEAEAYLGLINDYYRNTTPENFGLSGVGEEILSEIYKDKFTDSL